MNCDFCGNPIDPDILKSGKSMKLLGKTYCPECLVGAIQRGKSDEAFPEMRTPRPAPIKPKRDDKTR
jgi:hypothetical protein